MSVKTNEHNDKYKKEYNRIKGLINQFDPCGLIQLGAPDDEYDCLTDQLIRMVTSGTTIERLKSFITEEMENHFGVHIPTTEPYKSKFNKDLDEFAQNVRTLDKQKMTNG